jgi:UDPglucose--hexose-1-phosphate uridylyltransferase
MSEMRWNPVLGEWVVTATHRQDRTFLPPAGYCPLCPTAPGGFPTEVPRPAYDFVVFENKFPSLRRNPMPPSVVPEELYPVQPSEGVCEVVLYTSQHNATLAELPLDRIVQLVHVWKDRYVELGNRKEIGYVFIFENKGEAIGVTLHHPHGQIYAFPFVPPKVQREIDNENAHFKRTGQCLHCDVISQERADARRIVVETSHFVAFVPFYARYPYEVHIYAKEHLQSMAEFGSEQERDLGRILQIVLRKYDNLWGFSLPYMMVMHQKPTDGKDYPGNHFHIEFYPPLRTKDKLKYLAGCESGAGTFVNDTLAEEKASELRETAPFGKESAA